MKKDYKKTEKQLKGDRTLAPEVELLKKLKDILESGSPARNLDISDEEKKFLKIINYLVIKVLYMLQTYPKMKLAVTKKMN
ncbi:GTP-binding protein [Peptoniphilus indolicus ATCC 29427]|uniref:GTP-binding protein n=1 Tax=Peptoniphilus indolicus ATCC 29427 TaxID=997350 RepID=G4D5R6_9FIRM|nr:GTP-binding protein [Peptoniphilus indolicus ATCC 29427]